MSDSQRHRVDTWLKHVCLVKHRTDATEACRGGHVKVNGQRVKPASLIREGDVVELYAGDRYRKVVVKSVPEKQQAKEIARTMYADETPVIEKVDDAVSRERGRGRPTKRERRDADKFKRSY